MTFAKTTCAKTIRALPALALLAAFLAPGLALAHDDDGPKRFISLSATGTVEATSSMVEIDAGVTSQADTAKDALAKNSEAMAQVVSALKTDGIDPKDIQTSQFNVSPLREPYKDGGVSPKIIGYQVTNSVHIIVRDPAKLGQILDKVVSLGANEINSIAFGIAKPEALKDSARKQAMAQAIANAQLYADAAGVKLGKVLTITEDQAIMPPRPYARAAMEMKAAAAPPIEAGATAVEVRITATFELE